MNHKQRLQYTKHCKTGQDGLGGAAIREICEHRLAEMDPVERKFFEELTEELKVNMTGVGGTSAAELYLKLGLFLLVEMGEKE